LDSKQFIDRAKAKFETSLAHFNEELKKVRTGRAHPSMLDGVMVKAYGVEMPLNQVGGVIASETQLLQITPFDPNNIAAISDAIRNNQSLGMNPMDDGRVVRIPIPPLNTERRQQIVKQLSEKTEDTMIALRNIRHEILSDAKQAKNDRQMGEDDYSRTEKQIDDMMSKIKLNIEQLVTDKEREIMTV
jgi:ribosome recycling factor